MRARHRAETSTRSFDGQVAPLIHFEVFIDGKSVIIQCNFSPVRHFRLFEKGNLVKTILASHVHDVYQDPNSSTQIMVSLDFTESSMNLTKKKLMEMGSSLTLKVDSTSVNERDRLWHFLKASVDDDYDMACMQYHWPNVPILKEGVAKKKGKRLGGHSIWLVLHPGRLLLFKKQGGEVPGSVLLLTEVNVEALSEYSIAVQMRSRTYELSFPTAQEAEEWRIAIRCEIDLTTQLRPQNLPSRVVNRPPKTSISTKFDLSGALESSSHSMTDPNACSLPGCLNMKESTIDFCSKHANLQAKKDEKEEASRKEREQKVREEEEALRLKLLEEASNNPIFWKQAIEVESGERFYYNQAVKISQYARPLCLLVQDKLEAVQWTEMKDTEGRRAWHNIKTGVTTKTRPECLGRDPVMSHWKEAISETGEKYWYNKQLMQSTYDNPFLEELKRQERELLEAPACPPSMNDEKLRKEMEELHSTIRDLTAQVAMGQLKIQELSIGREETGDPSELTRYSQVDGQVPPPPYVLESQATINTLTKQVSDKTLSIHNLTKQVAEGQTLIQQLTEQLATAHTTIQQLTTQVTEGQAKIQQLQTELETSAASPPRLRQASGSQRSPTKSSESQAAVLLLRQEVADLQNTIQQLHKQMADTHTNGKLAEPQSVSPVQRQLSGTMHQKVLAESQLAEAPKQLVAKADETHHRKTSSLQSAPISPTAAAEAALTSRLDKLEEQNRQLMLLLQNQPKPMEAPPSRAPPARPAPRVSQSAR